MYPLDINNLILQWLVVFGTEWATLPITLTTKKYSVVGTIISGGTEGFAGYPLTWMWEYGDLSNLRMVTHTYGTPTWSCIVIGV